MREIEDNFNFFEEDMKLFHGQIRYITQSKIMPRKSITSKNSRKPISVCTDGASSNMLVPQLCLENNHSRVTVWENFKFVAYYLQACSFYSPE